MEMKTRFPREIFVKDLHEVCVKVASAKQMEYTRKPKYEYDKTYDSRVWVERIWAVGSFARGALKCGDLDLIFELDGQKKPVGTNEQWIERRYDKPTTSKFKSHFVGKKPNVSIAYGIPESNSYGVEFKDAVLIWKSGDESSDWQSRIEAIKPNPQAGRFKRPYDIFPFEFQQIGRILDIKDDLIRKYDEGVIDWEFIPLSKGIPENLPEPINKLSGLNIRDISFRYKAGKQAMQSLDRSLSIICDNDQFQGNWNAWDPGVGSGIALGGNKFIFGPNPIPELYHLDRLDSYAVCLVPHWSNTHPNGIWRIRRGPNHPLSLLASEVKFFTLKYDENPDRLDSIPIKSMDNNRPVLECDLFKDAPEAQMRRDSLAKNSDNGQFTVIEIMGDQLLEVLSLSNYATIEGRRYELFDGRLILKLEELSEISIDIERERPRG